MALERKQHENMGALEIFVIYERPRDYPAHFVVRRFFGELPTFDFAIAWTLDEARAQVPRGLVRLPRDPADEAQIFEVWL